LIALDTPSKETNAMIGGGANAAPVVSDVMGDVLPYLGIEPVYTEADLNLIEHTMPNLIGLTEPEAAEELAKRDLTYRTVGSGASIMGQLPAPGASIPGKSEVVIYFDQEAPTDLVTVPDFLTYNLNNANYLATSNGLYMLITGANKHDPNVTATYQDIPAGTEVPRGTMVTVEFTDYSAGE